MQFFLRAKTTSNQSENEDLDEGGTKPFQGRRIDFYSPGLTSEDAPEKLFCVIF